VRGIGIKHRPLWVKSRSRRTYSITSSAMAGNDGGTTKPSLAGFWALKAPSKMDFDTARQEEFARQDGVWTAPEFIS
jgi:hypothetical protein